MITTTIREGARIAALIVILVAAAILGLMVGNALNGRSGSDAGAAAAEAPIVQSDWHQRHPAGRDVNASLTRPTPR